MRIAQYKQLLLNLNAMEKSSLEKIVHNKVLQLEKERNLSRIYAVVDMDMFFAAVAMRDNPELVGKPVAIGGMSMISTANYEARKYNVRAAMPGFIARELCPDLIFVEHDFEAYQKASDQTREIFALYDPLFKAMSLDEAYLDLTDFWREHSNDERYAGGIEDVVKEIRFKVHEKTQLTCSEIYYFI